MCDKDTCNDASCCGECEPWNCLEQQVNDILATKEGQLQGYVDESKNSAAESKASAEASAQSAAESKEFRDEAETAASTAVAAEGVVLGVANTLQDTADKLEQVADELGTAIAGIAVSSWFYTTVSENQTVIPVPANKNAVDVQSIYIEGIRKSPFRGFEFDKTAMTITLAEPLPLGLEIEIVLGTYNSDNPNDFAHTLASNNGASLVGTSSGLTVQQELNNNLLNDREQWRRSLAEAGLTLVIGSFEEGATVSTRTDAVWCVAAAQCYTWTGTFPHTAESAPVAGWAPVTDLTLRTAIVSSQPGAADIGGFVLRFTPIAYGAKADGTTLDTAAFTACISAAPAGATIDLQGMTYLAEAVLTKNNLRIVNGTVIAPANASKGAVVGIGVDGIRVDKVNAVVKTDGSISYAADNVSGIHFESSQHITITDCRVYGSKNNNYGTTGSWGCNIHAYQCTNVNISNCLVWDADKEGIMTRLSDQVWIENCKGWGAGYSNIGTSGGDVSHIIGCASFKSGASGISVNSQYSVVSANTVEENGASNGIVVGHGHEQSQYAQEAVITGNIIRKAAFDGIQCVRVHNVVMNDNVIESAGLVSVANGLSVQVTSATNAQINIQGNAIRQVDGAGILVNDTSASNVAHCNIANNQIISVTGAGIYTKCSGWLKVSGNRVRSAKIGIQSEWNNNETKLRPIEQFISNNSIGGTVQSAIDVVGAEILRISLNQLITFNAVTGGTFPAIIIRSSVAGVNFDLPALVTIDGNVFSGTPGLISGTINVTDNGVAPLTPGIFEIIGNLFRSSAADPVKGVGGNKYTVRWMSGNRRGPDPTFISVSLLGSSPKETLNSNATSYFIPKIVPKNSSSNQVYFVGTENGKITLSNLGPNPAEVYVVWE